VAAVREAARVSSKVPQHPPQPVRTNGVAAIGPMHILPAPNGDPGPHFV